MVEEVRLRDFIYKMPEGIVRNKGVKKLKVLNKVILSESFLYFIPMKI
jgi:hypothetical protein